jgi:hypothetical protein
MRNFLGIIVIVLLDLWGSVTNGQEPLRYPDDEASKIAVNRASEWLIRHVRTGKVAREGREDSISVIGWKDPTLNPELPKQLAGYAITDTLWASYALTLTKPEVAKELHDSLETLGCLGNSLHEVIWRRVASIAHKPIDPDIVHGKSIGILSSGDESIDIRTFTVSADRDFEIGHPLLFAEHAVYQSLYEYRLGNVEAARNRLRKIFQSKPRKDGNNTSSEQHIFWDQEHGLLVDYVIDSEYVKFVKGESSSCRQYTFKLGVLLYACKLLGFNNEFPKELELMHRRLSAAQIPSGGISHFYDVDTSRLQILRCPDATGEATAIFMLAETVVSR